MNRVAVLALLAVTLACSGGPGPQQGSATVPAAPSAVRAARGNGQVTVSWEPPAHDGGSPLTGYQLISSRDGARFAAPAGARSLVVMGLSNGQPYRFSVVALNAVGESEASALSDEVTPATVPGPVRDVQATAGIREAELRWAAPLYDGGAPLLGYTVLVQPGALRLTLAADALGTRVEGLANGTRYTFTVVAVNAVGAREDVLPAAAVQTPALPGAPGGVSAAVGQRQATVTWTAPASDGGRPVTGYRVMASPGGATVTTTGATQAVVTGLRSGELYRFSVAATSEVGEGPASDAPSALRLPCVRCGFAGLPVLPSGGTPHAVVSADFDGDGTADLAVANDPGASVSVWRGLGDGSFGARSDLALAAGTSALLAAQLDGDGHMDLAVVSADAQRVQVLLGDGDLGFRAAGDHAVGLHPSSITSGDFNADGHLDLAVGTLGDYLTGGSVSVLLGTGTGTFLPHVQYSGANSNGVTSLVSADLNGDGALDLAMTISGFGSLTLLRGLGDGTFRNRYDLLPTGSMPSALAATDLNADGHVDLVTVSARDERVVVLQGQGDYTFRAPLTHVAALSSTDLRLADVDADGHVDVVVASHDRVSVLAGDGTGALRAGAEHRLALTRLEGLAVADFDGDGRLDLAVGYATASSVGVLLGQEQGGFLGRAAYAVGYEPGQLTARDLDGDGAPELLVANYGDATVSVLRALAGGGYAAQRTYEVGASPGDLVVADFTGDGHPDLITADRDTSGLSLLPGRGDATFGLRQVMSVEAAPTSLAAADFNGDGTVDLAVAHEGTDRVRLWLNTGRSSFLMGMWMSTGRFPTSLKALDLDADGRQDLAVLNTQGDTLSVWLGRGDGTFGERRDTATGSWPLSLEALDFNGDGKTDLAMANNLGNTVAVWLGNGDGTFGRRESLPSPVGVFQVAGADFDQDGRPDLAALSGPFSANAQQLSVWWGQGDGTFGAPEAYALGALSLVAADLDGDHRPDLAAAGGGQVAVLPNVCLR